jgi:hypothetical protein
VHAGRIPTAALRCLQLLDKVPRVDASLQGGKPQIPAMMEPESENLECCAAVWVSGALCNLAEAPSQYHACIIANAMECCDLCPDVDTMRCWR